MDRKLYRNSREGMIGGVCAGIAEYFDLDVSVVRILAALLLVAGWGSPVLVYIILWVVLPEKPVDVAGVPVPPSDPVDEMADMAGKVASSVAAGAQKVATTVVDAVKGATTGGDDSGAVNPGADSDPAPDAKPEPESEPVAPVREPTPSPAPAPVPDTAPAPESRKHLGGAVFFGALLVMVGAMTLIGRLFTDVPIWTFWPVVVVAIGFLQMVTPESSTRPWDVTRIFEGFGTVVLGVVLLGCTTGVISWRVFLEFVMLWPVLIIAAGLAVLGGALKSKVFRILASLTVTGTLIAASAFAYTGVYHRPLDRWSTYPFGVVSSADLIDYAVSEPLEGASDASLKIADAIGDIEITSASAGSLIELSGRTVREPAGFDVVRRGSTAEIVVDSDSGRNRDAMLGPETTCALSGKVRWSIKVDTGASSLDADLSALKVAYFELDSGAAEATVKLGTPVSSDPVNVKVDTAVSSVTLLVPRDAPVRVAADSAISGNSYGGLEKGADGAWYSDTYRAAASSGRPVWNIDLDNAVGAFSLSTY